MWTKIKEFDLYRKIPKDLTETSTHGAVLSVCASMFMLILFIAELWAFLSLQVTSNIIIDPNTESMLRINFNITVLDIPCEYAAIDVVDVLGTRNDNVTVNINKWQVDENGIRRGYEGRNPEQKDLEHDVHHDMDALSRNGIHAIAMDERNYDQWLEKHEYVFVNFYAPWCIWCQRLEPVWEAFAEKIEENELPVSVIKVDCIENKDLCMKEKIQAFPNLRLFKHSQVQPPDYRSDRTVDSLVEFIHARLSLDEQLKLMKPEEKLAHEERVAEQKDDHPGCMMSGFLLVNRVPGYFHIEMRSKHHNINPPMANLSHVVSSLSFGPLLPRSSVRSLEKLPKEYFTMSSLSPMDGNYYINKKLHQTYHHYIKVVSTLLSVGGRRQNKEGILAYQMVQSSQIMNYNEADIPEARFTYDLSPMAVVIQRKGKQWYEFVTSICALIGGTFTVMGLLSGFLNVIFKSKKM